MMDSLKFSDCVGFGGCRKMFSRMAYSVSRFAILLLHCNFPVLLGIFQLYSHLNWSLGNFGCWKFGSGWWCYCLSFSLFYFLLIVSLLGWGNALNKPGQLHNHHVILLETEEHLLFSGYVYTKHVLIIVSGVVQFQIPIHYSSMVAVTTSKLTTGKHRQPLFSHPRAAIHDMLRQWNFWELHRKVTCVQSRLRIQFPLLWPQGHDLEPVVEMAPRVTCNC